MFHTDREPAELQALTTYSEKHGDERESGLALKLSITMPNTVLDLFDPQLRAAFYRANDTISAQTDEPQADTPTPVLRFSALAGLRWTRQIAGAVVEIGAEDLLGKSQVRVTEATVDNFAFNLLEGGSVETTLRIKCKPDPEDVGALYERLRQTVLVTIRPPEHAQYEPAADGDPDQGELAADDDDGPTSSDDVPIPSATVFAKQVRAEVAKAKPAPKVSKKKSRAARAFPAALDGTVDRNPFDAAVDAAGGASINDPEAWPFPKETPAGTTPPGGKALQ